MTCVNAVKASHMTVGRVCKLDQMVCFNFDVDGLVAVCPAKLKEKEEIKFE
jgi:hypothetical protein